MRKKIANPVRRRIMIASLAAIAGSRYTPTMFVDQARAATLLRLAEDDPAAKALEYHINAADAPRVDKAGTHAEEQFCHNCSFIQADDGEWRPCQIFPSRAVSANGWCTAWSIKS
jgi:hypothetical protein